MKIPIAIVMIASAVALGWAQDFKVPDDVALRIRLDDTLTRTDSQVGILSAPLSWTKAITKTPGFTATLLRSIHPAE